MGTRSYPRPLEVEPILKDVYAERRLTARSSPMSTPSLPIVAADKSIVSVAKSSRSHGSATPESPTSLTARSESGSGWNRHHPGSFVMDLLPLMLLTPARL